MQNLDRDNGLLERIGNYCLEITAAHKDFGATWEAFQSRSTYRNAIALCLLQIGE